MLMRTSASRSTPVNAPLVNWLPWSLLNIPGPPEVPRPNARLSASTQKHASTITVLGHTDRDHFVQLHWQVIDLEAYKREVPSQVELAGALLTCLPTEPLARRLLERGIPVVRLGLLPPPHHPLMHAIIPGQAAACRIAAEHLAERDSVSRGGK